MRPSTSASQAWGSIVELGGDDQAVEQHGTLAAAIGTGEQPSFASGASGRAAPVGHADAAVVEEAGERGPALEHVVDGTGDVAVARQRQRPRRPALRVYRVVLAVAIRCLALRRAA